MKVAVLGSGPIAIEVATDLMSEGAAVKLIGKSHPGGHLLKIAQSLPETIYEFSKVSTEIGREVSCTSLKGDVSAAELFEQYYLPLIKSLESNKCIQLREVLRVQKQFLEEDEQIATHSRLFDLFRVTTALNASGMVEEQLKENPELREKIGEEILSSLKSRAESFEDFDLVIDARGDFQVPKKLGPAGYYALNEQALEGNTDLHYGFINSDFIKKLGSTQKITIVGSGYCAAFNLHLLEAWIGEKEGRVVNIVTPEKAAFRKLIRNEKTPAPLKDAVRRIIKSEISSWREKCEIVEAEILKWRALEPHEKVKITPPDFPTPKVCLYEGYTVTSVDRLLDQEATFLTLEIPRWRNENEAKELVTTAQDLILGSTGFIEEPSVIGPMQVEEPGFFKLRANGDIESSLGKIKLIKSQIFSYFSRAEGGSA